MIIFVFFSLLKNRKRLPLADIDESMTKKRSNNNRLSLIKMAHATRTFWTQAEALEFIAERQKSDKMINTVNMNKNLLRMFKFCFVRMKFYIYSLLNLNQMDDDDIKSLILISSFMNISKLCF